MLTIPFLGGIVSHSYTVMYPSIEYDQTHDTPTLVDLNDFRQQKVLIFM